MLTTKTLILDHAFAGAIPLGDALYHPPIRFAMWMSDAKLALIFYYRVNAELKALVFLAFFWRESSLDGP